MWHARILSQRPGQRRHWRPNRVSGRIGQLGFMPWGLWIAMRAISSLLVCLLGLGFVANATAAGTAAATSMSAGCIGHGGSAEHGSSSRDASPYNGDALSVPRTSSSSSHASSSSNRSGNAGGNSMDDNPTRFSNGDSTPDGSSHGSSGLSWQSLLPGSIQ